MMLGAHLEGTTMLSPMEVLQERTAGALDQAGRRTLPRSPSKTRSLSDGSTPILSPSPNIREPEKRTSKDDSIIESPTTPRRPNFALRGLSLQMPNRDIPPPSAHVNRAPLSPKLEHSHPYGSPGSVLPRRSRGLDFSRAATNLHHSTLAESSPDSSPTITGRAMNIPNRKNGFNYYSGSDAQNHQSSLWTAMPNPDRMVVSSSLGSMNMMGLESSGSSSEDDDLMDADDINDSMLTTPQAANNVTPYSQPSPGGFMGPSFAGSGFMNLRRARLRHGKGRHSSSSGSANSMISPSSKSPPNRRSIESTNNGMFSAEKMRRESISWTANQLNISGNESEDGTLKSTLENMESTPITPSREGQRGVIRRVVTRRGNMLPKTKGFARIRAALAEESAPVETEFRREAEVVRQTLESDMDLEPRHTSHTTHSSPSLGPRQQDSMEAMPNDEMMPESAQTTFKQQALRNSKGIEFWEQFDEKNRTPPQPTLPQNESSAMSEGITLDSPFASATSSTLLPLNTHAGPSESQTSPNSRSSTPQQGNGPTAAEITRKINNKRRRDEDFDSHSFKRRAVSPGMSVHNSPVIQSPLQRDVAPWGSRPPSNGETKNGGGTKRVGFQGMVDTNDGLMKMSIE